MMRYRIMSRPTAGMIARAGMSARWTVVVIVVGLGLITAACGSGGSGPPANASSPAAAAPSSASPSGTSVLCQDAAALRASLHKLTQVQIGAGTVSEIKADLQAVKSRLSALTAEARSQWQQQVSALKTALAGLQSAVAKVGSQPSTEAVAGVVTAVGKVNTAGQDLLAAINTDCPSLSPSPSM